MRVTRGGTQCAKRGNERFLGRRAGKGDQRVCECACVCGEEVQGVSMCRGNGGGGREEGDVEMGERKGREGRRGVLGRRDEIEREKGRREEK